MPPLNHKLNHSRLRRLAAFTLVEMLLVIAIISILAALVISSFSNAAQTSREIVVKQQLAVWQSALNNWVDGKLGRIDPAINGSSVVPVSLADLTTYYNSLTGSMQRFKLLTGKDLDPQTADTEGYLDSMTAQHYLDMAINFPPSNTAGDPNFIRSDAMIQTGQWITLPNWVAGSYPTVELHPTP